MKKNYIVIQNGLKDCGCACLLSVIRYYGGNVPMDKLLELTNTTSSGTNFYDITKAANEIGLSSKGYKLNSINKLDETEKPFISQVIINNYKHFVVVYKIKNNIITIMDPAKGMVKLTIDGFNKIWTSYILILTPYKKLPFLEDNNYLNSVIKKVIRNNKTIIMCLLLMTLTVTILTTIYGFYFKIIVDNYQKQSRLTILNITIIFTFILTIKVITEYLRNYLLIILNKRIDLTLITTAIKKIIHLPYNYYKNKTTGEVIARINDLFYLKHIITKIIITIFLDIILAIFILYILFKINLTMTYMVLIIIVIYFLIFVFYKPKQIKTINAIQETSAEVNSQLVETIASYETIKGLNLEDIFINKTLATYQNNIDNNSSLVKINSEVQLLTNLAEGIIIFYLIYFGIAYTGISLGTILTYNTLLFCFITPIKNSLEFYWEYYYAKNSIKRVNNLLNYKYESLDKVKDIKFNGDIKLNNLCFSYHQNKAVLKDINLYIKAKSRVVILGKTGSGKSTILKLIYRYYSPDKNQILIDNTDILDYPLLAIRSNITYVSQNELLYTDTIKNNIVLNRDISEPELMTICKLTYVDDIVKHNPLSYDMPIEENGTNLSGGERQRIILARSLLKPAKIILIDEGLNQIDINLERKILKNIFNYYNDKTFIIISHRKSNYDLYQKHYCLVDGKIKDDKRRNKWN